MTASPSQQSSESKKRINLWVVVAFSGVLLVLVLIGIRLFQSDVSSVRLGEKPTDFSLTTYHGEVINTADLRGKIILVNFWASWCTTCDEEAALLEAAWQGYQAQESAQVTFLGIAYMDTEPAARAFIENFGVTYPNGPDLRGLISKSYQVNSVPETFILDATGTLQYVKIGSFTSLDEILSAIDVVLNSSTN